MMLATSDSAKGMSGLASGGARTGSDDIRADDS
jgi:hypothetical protein